MINNLFRGKRCKDQEWVYGYLVESHRSWRGHKPHKSWIVDSPMTNGGWFALMGKSAVIDDTVGAYTGLKDDWRDYVGIDKDNVIHFGLWENDFKNYMKGE